MCSAVVTSIVGIALTFWFGHGYLSDGFLALCIGVSNLAFFSTLFVTLHCEAKRWIKGTLSVWGFFVVWYLGLMAVFFASIGVLPWFGYLIVPLSLSTGFAILAFGPLRDWSVKK